MANQSHQKVAVLGSEGYEIRLILPSTGISGLLLDIHQNLAY